MAEATSDQPTTFMDEIEEIRKRFKLTREGVLFHSHHLFTSRRLRRLPDMTLVYADEYEERLKEYEEKQKKKEDESVEIDKA
jgi:hypothetical protein